MTPYRRPANTPEELAAVAAQAEANAAWRREPCPCGEKDETHGWQPCRCGGHQTRHCWVCQREVWRPEPGEGCEAPGFGFSRPVDG